MRFSRLLIALVCTLFLVGCGSESPSTNDTTSNPNTPNALTNEAPAPVYDDFEVGKVIDAVPMKNDAEQSYALYLPSNYTADFATPIIFLFDSHGSGTLPVSNYKGLAEEFGYALVGSNVSKNGMPAQQLEAHLKVFWSDVHQRINVDEDRTYSMGFSGGARVAASFAQRNPDIDAVIGCSAGFAPDKHKFPFLGIVGDGDFNYMEMQQLADQLEIKGQRNHLAVFHGTHAWPDETTARQAFQFTALESMRTYANFRDDELIDKWYNNELSSMSAVRKLFPELEQQVRRMTVFYEELRDLREVDELTSSEAYQKMAMEYETQLIAQQQQETALQQELLQHLQQADVDYFKTKIPQIKKLIESTTDATERALHQRALGYVGIAVYAFVHKALNANRYDITKNFLVIYEIAEPENNEHQYLNGVLAAKEGKSNEALLYLHRAVQLGFSDVNRIKKEPAFQNFLHQSDFAALLTSIS